MSGCSHVTQGTWTEDVATCPKCGRWVPGDLPLFEFPGVPGSAGAGRDAVDLSQFDVDIESTVYLTVPVADGTEWDDATAAIAVGSVALTSCKTCGMVHAGDCYFNGG